MNMVNLFNLGAVEKAAKPAASYKDKGQAKKEFDKVFQDLRKQEVAPKENQKNKPMSQSLNKLEHVVKSQVKALQHETKGYKANAEDETKANKDFITQINQVVDLLNQIQQSIQALNQASATNGLDNESQENLVNEVVTLLDSLKELAQDVPFMQALLGNAQLQDLNSLIAQMIPVQDQETEEQPEMLLALAADSNQLTDKANNSALNQKLTNELANILPKDLLAQLKTLGTEGSKENLSEAVKNLTNSFANLQQSVNELASKTTEGNPLMQELLAKLNETAAALQPAISLISKFPSILPKLQNAEVDGKDSDQLITDEALAVDANLAEEQKVVTNPVSNQDLNNTKLQLDKENQALTADKGLKADKGRELAVTDENDSANLLYSPLVQDKQTNNLQQIQKLSQIQANATKGLGESVVDQLVQKATLMVKENFSEMKIQLTPHNLGKVDLQISIERGIVVARFAAESQQVKELIESNLTNLKQQLTNQGLKVDQLTVNVGQQGFNQSNGYANQQANLKPNAKRVKFEDGEEYQGVLAEEVQEVTRRYYSDNEVDYTA